MQVRAPECAVPAQKALQGSETETMELLGGPTRRVLSRKGVIDLPSKQINDFLQKGNRKKIELVARPRSQFFSFPQFKVISFGQLLGLLEVVLQS